MGIEMNHKVKKIAMEIVKKIPLFIFCVLFINGYNWAFGTENSIVGVVLLMGLLILMGTNLEYNVGQAAVGIGFLFIILAFAPKLSLLNPWIGLLVNIVSLTLIMILSGCDLTKSGYLPFMMGYIMLQGYDVVGVVFDKRCISLIIGGIVVGLFYYFIHKKNPNTRTVMDLIKENSLHSQRTQQYIRLVVTLVLVMFFGDIFGFSKTMWIGLTVLSLSTHLEEEYKSRFLLRIPATIIGSIVVFALFEKFVPMQYQAFAILLAGFLSMFVTSYFIKTIYNSFSALIAAILIFPPEQAVEMRIIGNILGVVIAFISVVVFSVIFNQLAKRRNGLLSKE